MKALCQRAAEVPAPRLPVLKRCQYLPISEAYRLSHVTLGEFALCADQARSHSEISITDG